MSYILEALRRAQAERERGQVPGLDARPVADLAQAPQQGLAASPWRWAVALGLGAAALAAVMVWRWSAAPAALPEPLPAAAAPLAVPAPRPAPAPPPAVPAPAPMPVVVSAPAPVLAAPVAAAPVAVAVPAPAASTAVRAARLSQLPPDLRRELPALAVGGAMWSESSASRFVIIDGQVLREGESAAPGVVLERIAQKAAWLRWRDWRIELNF